MLDPRIAWFPPSDKAAASAVNAAKSTLGDTDDDIGFERSAKGCLRTLARRLKLCSEHS